MTIALTRPRPAVIAAALVLLLMLGLWPARPAAAAPDPDVARIAFLARSDNPVDALAAGAIAAQLGGVLLVTPPNQLVDATEQALVDFGPDLVILAGGTAALSNAVEQAVADLGFATERAAGPDRHATAAALADLLTTHDPAYIHRSDGPSLTRVAGFVEAGEVVQPLGSPLLTIASVDITAPSDGWLVVQGGARLARPGGEATVNCFATAAGSQRTIRLLTGSGIGNCQTGTLLQVTAGDHTVNLMLSSAVPLIQANRVRATHRSLTVQFVPYDGDGQLVP